MYSFVIIFLGLLPPALLFGLGNLQKRREVISPLILVGWAMLLGYTLKSLYLSYAVHTSAGFQTKHLTWDIIPLGQLLVCFGTIAFMIGFAAMSSSRRRLVVRPVSQMLPSILPSYVYWGLYALSVVLLVLYFRKMGFDSQLASLKFASTKFFVLEEAGTRTSLSYLLIGADFLLVFLLYYLVNGKGSKWLNPFTLAMLFAALLFFMASKRLAVLIILVAVLLVVRKVKRNRDALKLLRRGALLVGALLVVTLVSQIRNQREEVSLTQFDVVESVAITVEHAMGGAYFMDPAKLSAIVDRNPGYLYGASFAMFLVAPIPRVLWPSKPVVRLGPYVAQEILDYNNDSGSPPSAIGEFYLNFGILGVLFGMSCLGAVAALLYRAVPLAPDPGNARVRYTLFMLCIVLFLMGDFSYVMILLIKFGFASVVCEHYWRAQARRDARRMVEQETPANTAVQAGAV